MKFAAKSLLLMFFSGAVFAQTIPPAPAFPPQIKNVIVIFQENRTPDNLFHFLTPLCPIPAGATGLNACTPSPVTTSCYNVSTCGLSNQSGTVLPITLTGVPMKGSADPSHTHKAFEQMCDPDPITFQCRNDGAWQINSSSYAFVRNPPVTNSDGSAGHLLDPYLTFAEQYGWANYMYQTNQGPSYPAHQFIFSGTSAPTQLQDTNSTFVSENFMNSGGNVGCLAPKAATTSLISPLFGTLGMGCTPYDNNSVEECSFPNTSLVYPTNPVGSFCYNHQSMADVLDPNAVSWKYYAASPGSIWTAPNSFQGICVPQFVNPVGDPTSPLQCTGAEWNANVDTKNLGTDILRDITNCNLSKVNWVIPNGTWSDHAGSTDNFGPSWVAAIINAIGNNPPCAAGTPDAGQTFWNNTAIVVTWDDWGGWSDNQPARILSTLPCTSNNCQGDYQLGFRVPLIVVSAYTPQGYINNVPHDFGSILRMIEGINSIPEGSLGFADQRATSDLRQFFTGAFRQYHTVPALKDASFFLSQIGAPAVDPDND